MDWTTLVRSQQADFIQRLKTLAVNRIQRLSKLALSLFLALLISLTGVVIPGLPLTSNAEALPINKVLPPSVIKNTLRGLETARSFIPSGNSFLSDNSIVRANFGLNANIATIFGQNITQNLPLTFSPNFVLDLAPTLFRFNFYFDIKEFNLVKIINDQSSRPSPALDYYKQGVEKTQKGDYKNAVKYYSDALSKDGNFAEAYVSRGRAYSELGVRQRANEYQQLADEYQQLAIKDYTNALKVKPKFEEPDVYVEPLLGRGAVYIKLGDYQAALDDFSLAIKSNPNFYDAYLGRSTIYLGLGDYQKALKDLNAAIYLDLDYPAAFLRRGSIRGELGEYEQAIADFDEVIESKEEDASNYYADAYYKRGLAYFNLGEEQEAIADFTQAINRDSNYTEAYYNRGFTQALLGEEKKAIEDYNQALQRNSVYTVAYYQRGLAYSNLGEQQKAIKDFDEAIRLIREEKEAIEDYNKELQHSSKYSEVYYQPPTADLNQGKEQKQVNLFTETIHRLNTKYAEAYYNRGNGNLKLGNHLAAIENYTQAIQVWLWQSFN